MAQLSRPSEESRSASGAPDAGAGVGAHRNDRPHNDPTRIRRLLEDYLGAPNWGTRLYKKRGVWYLRTRRP